MISGTIREYTINHNIAATLSIGKELDIINSRLNKNRWSDFDYVTFLLNNVVSFCLINGLQCHDEKCVYFFTVRPASRHHTMDCSYIYNFKFGCLFHPSCFKRERYTFLNNNKIFVEIDSCKSECSFCKRTPLKIVHAHNGFWKIDDSSGSNELLLLQRTPMQMAYTVVRTDT